MSDFLILSTASFLSSSLPQDWHGRDCASAPCPDLESAWLRSASLPWRGERDLPSLLGALLYEQLMARLSLAASAASSWVYVTLVANVNL